MKPIHSLDTRAYMLLPIYPSLTHSLGPVLQKWSLRFLIILHIFSYLYLYLSLLFYSLNFSLPSGDRCLHFGPNQNILFPSKWEKVSSVMIIFIMITKLILLDLILVICIP